MSDPKQDFLDAEEQARQIVSALEALRAEALSYKAAGRELENVRGDLQSLINQAMKTATAIQDSIKLLSEIGAPEILGRLGELEGDVGEVSEKITKSSEEIKGHLEGKMKTYFDKFEKSGTEKFDKVNKFQLFILGGIGVVILLTLIPFLIK